MKAILLLNLICTTAAFADSSDTYNFYFQKAPGPVTVNQGAAANANPAPLPMPSQPASTPVASPQTAPLPPAPAVEAGGTSVAMAETSPRKDVHSWEFSVNQALSYKNEDRSIYFTNKELPGRPLGDQTGIGLQYNLTPLFGLYGELNYLRKYRETELRRSHTQFAGRKTDFSIGLAVTPVRAQIFSGLKFSLTGMGGLISVPYEKVTLREDDFDWVYNNNYTYKVEHKTVTYYGARASFELFRTIALQASIKRLEAFDAAQKIVSIAYLF